MSEKIERREDVNPEEGKRKYGDVEFADPVNNKYPVDTPEHLRAAWSYINHKDNAAKYAADEVKKTLDVKEMLERAVRMEEQSATDYNRWANECSQHADSVSKKLFEDLVMDEERHYDQYDTELDNIGKFGEKYLVLQSIERSKNLSAGTPRE